MLPFLVATKILVSLEPFSLGILNASRTYTGNFLFGQPVSTVVSGQ